MMKIVKIQFMVHIEKDYTRTPVTLTSKECIDNINDIIKEIGIELNKKKPDKEKLKRIKAKISEKYYRGCKIENNLLIQDVVIELKRLYNNKCAYCETIDAEPNVEHYRPKKAVVGLAINHNGYYWLSYEYSNLLPVCEKCNKAKGFKFPIIAKNNRVYSPPLTYGVLDYSKCKAVFSPLIHENPYLLHPEIDVNFHNYFSFNIEAIIKGIDDDKKGEKTIEICNLNRDTLLINRKAIIEDYRDRIIDALYYAKNNFDKFSDCFFRIMEKLLLRVANNREYSLLSLFLHDNFDTLLLPTFELSFQKKIKEAWDNYVSSINLK